MKKAVPYIIIVILSALLIYQWFFRKEDKEVIVKTGCDTTFIYRTDTLTMTKIEHKTVRVIDTMYIHDTAFLPVVQKYYSEKDAYDLWISGVNPNLDSIKTYRQYIYKTINNNTIEKRYISKWSVYANIGVFKMPDDYVTPYFDINVNTPKRLSFGANIGVYDNRVIYGVHIGCRLY